jgi:hypothetical protein
MIPVAVTSESVREGRLLCPGRLAAGLPRVTSRLTLDVLSLGEPVFSTVRRFRSVLSHQGFEERLIMRLPQRADAQQSTLYEATSRSWDQYAPFGATAVFHTWIVSFAYGIVPAALQ